MVQDAALLQLPKITVFKVDEEFKHTYSILLTLAWLPRKLRTARNTKSRGRARGKCGDLGMI